MKRINRKVENEKMRKAIYLMIFLGVFLGFTDSASAQNCRPNANQIAVFEDANYRGKCSVRNVGEYRSSRAFGLKNDSLSSIIIGRNVMAILYEHNNFGGKRQTFSRTDANLRNNLVGNDSVSSIRVIRKNYNPPNRNYRYCANEGQRCNFSGRGTVAYGINGKFKYRRNVSGGLACNNRTFGDPFPGVEKRCFYLRQRRPTIPRNRTNTPRTPVRNNSRMLVGIGNKCLDVSGGSRRNGTNVTLWDCHGGENQRWTYTSKNELRIFGNKCLDVDASRNANGSRLQIWDCTGGSNQKWRYMKNGEFRGWGRNKCLDVKSSETSNGTQVLLWNCQGQSNQRWRFQRTTARVNPPSSSNNNRPRANHAPPNSNYRFCAREGGSCNYGGIVRIAYGVNGKFKYKSFRSRETGPGRYVSTSTVCNNRNFGGDPAPGVPKRCYIQGRGPGSSTSAITGRNVKIVRFSKGSFRQIRSGKTWVEYKSNNTEHARFTETGRDRWNVYLRKSDGARIQLDLRNKVIKINGRRLYAITSVWAP